MGTTTIYLLPNNHAIDPPLYASRVKSVLTDGGVIRPTPYHPKYPHWHPPGLSAASAFLEVPAGYKGFEYCIVTGAPTVELVPQDPASDPHCPACNAELVDSYYDLVNTIEESCHGREKS